MFIKKIVKTYFLLAMASMVLFVVPHLKSRQDFMANVLGIGTYEESFTIEKTDIIPTLTLEIVNGSADNYASPGDNKKIMMEILIGDSANDLRLEELKIKILNVDPLAIKKAVLIKDDTPLLKANRKNEYLVFRNLNLTIPKGTEQVLSVAVSLNDAISTGERMQLQIEKPGDIILFVDGFISDLSPDYFPIKSPYLTVVKTRPKFKFVYE